MSITLILFLQRAIIQKLFKPIKIFIKSDKMLTIFESSWQALDDLYFLLFIFEICNKTDLIPDFPDILAGFQQNEEWLR